MLLQTYANIEERSPKDAYYMPAQADRCEVKHMPLSQPSERGQTPAVELLVYIIQSIEARLNVGQSGEKQHAISGTPPWKRLQARILSACTGCVPGVQALTSIGRPILLMEQQPDVLLEDPFAGI